MSKVAVNKTLVLNSKDLCYLIQGDWLPKARDYYGLSETQIKENIGKIQKISRSYPPVEREWRSSPLPIEIQEGLITEGLDSHKINDYLNTEDYRLGLLANYVLSNGYLSDHVEGEYLELLKKYQQLIK